MCVKQLKNLGNSINAINSIQEYLNNFTDLEETGAIEALKEATAGYSTEVLKLATSQVTLSTAQATAIFEAKGLTGAELEQAVANATLSASQKKATISTGTLGTAFKGLGAKIKATTASMWAFLTTTPAGWATLAVAAIGSVVAGVYAYNKAIDKAVDNAKEKLSEVSSKYDEVTSKIAENNEKIKELEVLRESGNLSIVDSEDLDELKAQNEELRIRQQYLEKQKEISNQEIVEASKNKYNRDYGRQDTSNINAYKEKLSNPKPINNASSYLTGEGGSQYQSSSYAAGQQDALNAENDALAALIAQYQFYEEEKTKALQAQDSESIEKYSSKLSEIGQKLMEDRTQLQGFLDDLSLTGESSSELDDVNYKLELIDNTLLSKGKQLVEFINDSSFKEQKEKLAELADSGKLTVDTLAKSFPELNQYLIENGLTLEDLIGLVKTYREELESIPSEEIKEPLSIADTITQLDTQLRPALEALKKSYQDIFTEDGFTLENVDISMLNNVLDVMNEMKEAGLGIDTSGFENLAKVLTDSSSTAEQVQGAFDNLASTILNSTNITGNLTDETAALVTTLLEEMGVANAQEIVYASLNAQTEALALQKQFAAQTGHELVNATNDEVIAFLNHAGASETARVYLFQLVAAEQVFNDTDLSVEDKIAKLKELATAYGQTAIAARIANMEKANQEGHISIDYNKELASLQNEINGAINNVKVDFNGIGGGSKSASKAGKEAADAYLEAFETELKKLDDLKSRGKQQLPLITVM